MKITFNNPVTVGTLGNQITFSAMQLKSLSFNLAGSKGAPNVLVSTTLTDPASGHDEHFVYEDSTLTPAFFTQVAALQISGKSWLQVLIERLQGDNKLPAGTITP